MTKGPIGPTLRDMKKATKKALKRALKEKRVQDDSLRIRMMKVEHALLQKAAKLSGNKVSAWARDRLLRVAREELAKT